MSRRDPTPTIQEKLEQFSMIRYWVNEPFGLIQDTLANQGQIVLEGAQGALLDNNWGTYPYCTASVTLAGGAPAGLGIAPNWIAEVIGVAKAFQTRVGEGAFPTELNDAIGDHLRGTGDNLWDEFGTTTGRPRRCGWLDGILLRYAVRINGLTEIAITKLDILTGLNQLFLATAYQREGIKYEDLPEEPVNLEGFAPDYERLSGWESEITHLRDWEALPSEAQEYVARIEQLINLRSQIISVGAERNQVILRQDV